MKVTILLFALLMACITTKAQDCRTQVVIQTTHGDIHIALANETPKHRDNFIKLAESNFYDSLLFHRVIKHFMVQAGDPKSKYAEPGITLGDSTLGYKLPAEICLPALYHKRGAVAMAREGDEANPDFLSDACQFYIVWGKTFSSKDIEMYNQRLDSISGGKLQMTEEMTRTYRKIGGTPHLDGTYTVFGEVTKGIEVIEKIQGEYTDDYDRPVDDIRILKTSVIKK